MSSFFYQGVRLNDFPPNFDKNEAALLKKLVKPIKKLNYSRGNNNKIYLEWSHGAMLDVKNSGSLQKKDTDTLVKAITGNGWIVNLMEFTDASGHLLPRRLDDGSVTYGLKPKAKA